MKRFVLFSFMTMCLIINLLAQKSNQKSNSPKENSTVKREYDENGNLIRFDSTYTYSWSGDTTLMKQMNPEDMNNFFNGHLKFFNDSSFFGNSFFDDFDQMFSHHMGMMPDSTLMKKFGKQEFHSFKFDSDSLAEDFPDFNHFFGFTFPEKNDSVSAKGKKEPFATNRHSMDDVMKMFQEQMKAMEEQHRKFFKEEPKWQEF